MESIFGLVGSSLALAGVVYIVYWCCRLASYTWSGLTGRSPARRRPVAPSPTETKVFHAVGILGVLVLLLLVLVLIAVSQMRF